MQSNKSCMLLRKNYLFSGGKGSKHMHVRYFFAVNKVEKEEVKIVHCPIEKVIADCRSKLTQGTLLAFHRNSILGVKEEDFRVHKE